MPGTNNIFTFAQNAAIGQDGGVMSQDAYANEQQRIYGQNGLAQSQINNKALKQSSFVAAGVAQFIANNTEHDVNDTDTLDVFDANLVEALKAVLAPVAASGNYNDLTNKPMYTALEQIGLDDAALKNYKIGQIAASLPAYTAITINIDPYTVSDIDPLDLPPYWFSGQTTYQGMLIIYSGGPWFNATFSSENDYIDPVYFVTTNQAAGWDSGYTDVEWKEVGSGDSQGVPIGFIYPSLVNVVDAGSLPLIYGPTYTREAYQDLWNYANSIEGYVKTDAEWTALYTTNEGNVPYFSSGDGTATFRVPCIKDFVQGSDGLEDVGAYSTDTQRNATGSLGWMLGGADPEDGRTGVFEGSNKVGTDVADGSGGGAWNIYFDASKSVGADHTGTEVKPKSIKTMWQIKAFGTTTNVGNADVTELAAATQRVETEIAKLQPGAAPLIDCNDLWPTNDARIATGYCDSTVTANHPINPSTGGGVSGVVTAAKGKDTGANGYVGQILIGDYELDGVWYRGGSQDAPFSEWKRFAYNSELSMPYDVYITLSLNWTQDGNRYITNYTAPTDGYLFFTLNSKTATSAGVAYIRDQYLQVAGTNYASIVRSIAQGTTVNLGYDYTQLNVQATRFYPTQSALS